MTARGGGCRRTGCYELGNAVSRRERNQRRPTIYRGVYVETNHLTTAILARNEADKYLDRVVRHHARFGRVLVLDDHSDDATPLVAAEAGATVHARGQNGGPMWGRESTARAELWDWAAKEAGLGWVLICDADQLLMGDPRPLCTSWTVNTWAFPLYDLWDSEETYRADGFWQGYRHNRAWLFRPSQVPEGWNPEWSSRGIHTGHCPANWPGMTAVAPPDVYWLHLGWLQKADRLAKYERYRQTWDQLTPFERGHVMSIVET